MQTYKELIVWQKSITLACEIYLLTDKFPKSEMFGLVSQMRRAAVSISSNIAEGSARGHRAEYIQFLRVSFGSAAELETQLILCRELSLIGAEESKQAEQDLQEVLRMLNKLISSLSEKKS